MESRLLARLVFDTPIQVNSGSVFHLSYKMKINSETGEVEKTELLYVFTQLSLFGEEDYGN